MKLLTIVSVLASCYGGAPPSFAAAPGLPADCNYPAPGNGRCKSSAAEQLASLIDQSWLWQAKNRVDLSRDVLLKALHIYPANPVVLQRLVEIEAESGRPESAAQYLQQLAAAGDRNRYLAASESFDLFKFHGHEIKQARLLSRNGRSEQALAMWNALISGIPQGHLALEVLPLRNRFGNREALFQLQVLANRYTNDPRYAEYRNTATPAASQSRVADVVTRKSVRRPDQIVSQTLVVERESLKTTSRSSGMALAMSYELGAPEQPQAESGEPAAGLVAEAGRAVLPVFPERDEPRNTLPLSDQDKQKPAPNDPPPDWAWQLSRKWLNNPGTPGVSDLNQSVDLAHLERDTAASKTRFWLENWDMDGGAAQGDQAFGTANASTPPWTLAAQGIGFGLAYETAGWRFDFGHTPSGFAISYPVFGIRKQWIIADTELSAEVSRRPLAESILSFAGARDPQTGQTWGGAKATGLKLAYDTRINAWGVGAKAAFYRINGDDILDNQKLDLSAKANYRFKLDDNIDLKVGVSLTHWRYSDNTNYYRFGHGGYYSPKKYISLDFPLELIGESGRHSYRIAGGVSYGYKQTNDVAEFPLTQTGSVFDGSSSYGGGSYLSATWEYRITDTLALGARAEHERSSFYEPTTVMLYVRYDNPDRLRWRATYPRDSYFKE
ncbi:MAG: cellulose synthase subunit BcsC-related outer membrane protein [Thiobacillaceae bacterium]